MDKNELRADALKVAKDKKVTTVYATSDGNCFTNKNSRDFHARGVAGVEKFDFTFDETDLAAEKDGAEGESKPVSKKPYSQWNKADLLAEIGKRPHLKLEGEATNKALAAMLDADDAATAGK